MGYSPWVAKELDTTWGLNNDSNMSIFPSNPQLRFFNNKIYLWNEYKPGRESTDNLIQEARISIQNNLCNYYKQIAC